MNEKKTIKQLTAELKEMVRKFEEDGAKKRIRYRVNKLTHRVRYEDETEQSVEVIIEPKQSED